MKKVSQPELAKPKKNQSPGHKFNQAAHPKKHTIKSKKIKKVEKNVDVPVMNKWKPFGM
jgi:hypothetical protein